MPATTPQDHKKPAAQVEAEKPETVDITWRDRTFTIPASTDDWSIETLEAFEDGKGVAMVRDVLGPKQWAEFRKTGTKTRDLNELGDAIAEAMGFEDAGN